MATFFINETGVVTTASTGSDSIYIQSAAVKDSEILGLAGNDTIRLTEGAAANTSSFGGLVRAGEDDDYVVAINLSAFSAGGHTIIGGAGNDTISIIESNFDQVKGNGGDDRVAFSAGTVSSIGLGGGADTISLTHYSTVTRLSLGDGHDLVSAGSKITFATAASVIGGGGRDTIQLEVKSSDIGSAFINGGALQDLISLESLRENSTVKGMGGADTIMLTNRFGNSAFIAAGAGADVVTLSGRGDVHDSVGSTIAGGSGNDSIAILHNIATLSALILGGAGADSISFNGIADEDDYSKVNVMGGLGADTITFSAGAIASGAADSTKFGTVKYSSFSESNLANEDLIDLNNANITSGGLATQLTFEVDFADPLSSVSVSEVVGAVKLGDATFSGNIAASVLTISGIYNVSSTTALAGTVDTLTLAGGRGASVLFTTKGGNNFLFVQGGTTGTDDDSIIGLGTLSGAGIGFTTNNADITFSGQT